jgi:predicted pyridoxine 5'-phosphate oxidase superfamily flavin-nucleotide-binding protein
MSIDADVLPLSQIEELVRALVKGLRAFQMYLPNNPMYQRAEHGIREAFPPVWEVTDDLTLLVQEADLIWEDQVVYHQPSRSDSFAWGLYKDGMRLLSFRKGSEAEEVTRFLQTVARARLLPADASDDLLTLLWEQDLKLISYEFAEVIAEPWVYDPQALDMEAEPLQPATVQQQVREEVAAPRPEGVVDPDEFDSTLYFLDEGEIGELRRQVEEEYARDIRASGLSVLFDVFEAVAEIEVRHDILSMVETLFPNLLARGEFRNVAFVLREFRLILERVKHLDAETRRRVEVFTRHLSEPGTLRQLLQTIDEAASLPAEEDLGEVLRELQAPALGEILTQLPRLSMPRVRDILAAAAERLGSANHAELIRLLGVLDAEAVPGAIQLTGRLGLLEAAPALGELVRHPLPAARLAAVEVLGALGTPAAMAALEPALDDEERPVRVAAVAAVTRRGYVGALRRLEATVLGRNRRVLERAEKRALFEAFAAIAGPRGIDTLRTVLTPQGLFRRRADTETRTCAVYAVGRLRSPDARALLEQLSEDKELPVRHAAVSLLREWQA